MKKLQILSRLRLCMAFSAAVTTTSLLPVNADVLSSAQFRPRVSRLLGGSALWTVAGDFNGDSRVDIAVGSSHLEVAIFATGPDGALPLSGVKTATFDSLSHVRAGDLNGDGRSDLVGTTGRGIEVMYGQTNSTFAGNVVIGQTSNFIIGGTAIGDLNGDGRLDIVASEYSRQVLLKSYGIAAGGFTAISGQVAGSNSRGLAVSDLNRDGQGDVIIGDASSNIYVAYGTANGDFSVRTYGVLDRSYEVVAGDFNRDGIPDVAFPAWNHGAIGVMLTNANGSLGEPSYFPTTVTPDSIAMGDFNHDGIADLAVASEWGNIASVLLGNGSGAFGSRVDLTASANGTAIITAGDFDGNGYDDIAIAAASGTSLDVFFNANSVPEPASVLLAAISSLMLSRPFRHGHQCRQTAAGISRVHRVDPRSRRICRVARLSSIHDNACQ